MERMSQTQEPNDRNLNKTEVSEDRTIGITTKAVTWAITMTVTNVMLQHFNIITHTAGEELVKVPIFYLQILKSPTVSLSHYQLK